MSFKKSIISLLIVFLAIVTGCSKNVLIDEQNSKLLNYDFKISDVKNVENSLINQRYSYSTNIDKKFIAVITYQSRNASIQQYIINKDGTADLTIPKDSNFIISFPANRTITYTWNIKNNIGKGVIQLENRSWIEVPIPKSEKGKIGENYDRQNFYFKPIKTGNEKVLMRYEHETQQRDEFFQMLFNIRIQ